MLRGVIEGFYGTPWTWEERRLVARWCADRGMGTSIWAPKADPLHRDRWRDPWTEGHLVGFAVLAEEPAVEVGVALAPGLVDGTSTAERAALAAKVDPLLDVGVVTVVLAFDDIPSHPDAAANQVALACWLHDRLDGRAALALVPTEYVGQRSTPYLDALARGLPGDVPIGWTGSAVVNDVVTVAEAEQRAASLGGRLPLLWDNFPVNDFVMEDRLFLGPLRGREPGLAEACSGYLANPMRQPRCSLLPLASTAAWLAGDDPGAAWATTADALGLRVLAEACDGEVPRDLVDALDAEGGGPGWIRTSVALADWLAAAARCEAPGLEGEADEWAAQARAEADVGLAALRLYASTKPALSMGPGGAGRARAWTDASLLATLEVMRRWPAVRRSPVSVLGPRCSFRPVLGQRDGDGGWQYRPESLQEGDNALDLLARMALDEVAAAGPPGPVSVIADGQPVEVAPDGTFAVAPGSVVVARCGRGATGARGAVAWPIPDGRL